MAKTLEEAVKHDINKYIAELKEMAFQLGYQTAHNDFLEIRKNLEDSAYNHGYEAAKKEFDIPSVPIDFINKEIDKYSNIINAKKDIRDEQEITYMKMMLVGMDTILSDWEEERKQALS